MEGNRARVCVCVVGMPLTSLTGMPTWLALAVALCCRVKGEISMRGMPLSSSGALGSRTAPEFPGKEAVAPISSDKPTQEPVAPGPDLNRKSEGQLDRRSRGLGREKKSSEIYQEDALLQTAGNKVIKLAFLFQKIVFKYIK